MKRFIIAIWQFCSYLFWPQQRPKDYYDTCIIDESDTELNSQVIH